MGRTRVYELAKELGLENKAVLDMCTQLGFEGKTSHSNSLTDEEAEKIRRSVIRRAVSGKGAAERDVTTDAGKMTERRVGNVIRRRKKTDEPEPESEQTIDLSDVPQKDSLGAGLTPDLGAERDKRNEALAQADALFQSDSEGEEEETALSEDQETPLQPLEEEEGVGEEVALSEEEQEMSQTRRRHDIRAPKVLGKIELPVAEARSSKSETGTSPLDASKEEVAPARGKTKSSKTTRKKSDAWEESSDRPKKKRRKVQVLKKDDLVDYEGEREAWRSRRDKKLKKGKGDSRSDGGSPEPTQVKASKRVVKIDSEISVGEFAKVLGAKLGEVIRKLMDLGHMATVNDLIDFDTATILASEFDFTTVNTGHDEDELIKNLREEDKEEDLALRPPVVTVMGHVDHGKTSLLDAIRKTAVTEREAGGITQHIGAYNVKLGTGGSVTFLDTPGHEAFTAMRSRGAKVTDIVVLVVAADDGVMPQTIEAINHAKAAEVPIIVALNKIDKEGADQDRIRNQLSEYQLISEDWGGETLFCPVSAKTGDGVTDLLENLHLQAEVLELKANAGRQAIGTVVESKLEKGRGPVLTVLVQNGTLKKGNIFFSGAVSGKVRALIGDDGHPVDEAGPSIPVEILGSSGTPKAGDDFFVVESESEAKRVAEERERKARVKQLASRGASDGGALTLERFSEMVGAGEAKELPLIVKGDVQGSVEAVSDSIQKLSNEEVTVKVVHKAVGGVSENDVQLAVASKAIIIGFSVRADSRASALAETEKVEILYSRVIYELVEAVEKAMTGLLDPVFKEKTLGRAEVRQTFKVPKLGTIAGSYVVEGNIVRNSSVRLLRDNIVVFEGKMASLRRFKEDVKEVQAGYECGIGIEGYSDIHEGDTMEIYKMEEVQR